MNLSFLTREIAPFNLYKVLWMLVLWILRIIVTLIAGLIGILLMILQAGFLSDLAVTPWWVKAQRESRQYFTILKDHRFQAAPLTFAVKDENAWGYYNRAAQWLYDMEGDDKEIIHSYGCQKFTFADSERVVERYERAFAVWDSGTSCRYCAIPTDYEKGRMKPMPNYIGLQHLAELALVNAEVELFKGDSHKAAEIYAKVLKMGADIGGGEQEPIGQMVGVVIARKTEEPLKTNINSFDLEALTSLKLDLQQTEGNWPRFDTALEADGRSFLLPSSTGWDGMKLFVMDGGGPTPPLYIQILSRITYSLVSWRRGLSGRLTTIAASRRVVDLAKRCRAVQKRDWESIRPILVSADSEVERDSRHWDITVIPVPNVNRMYQRIYAALLTMRVVKGALWLREYKLRNKKFPDNLESFLASDTTYYDLANSQPLHFLRDSTGQTIRLYSIGLNLKDDKGEGNPKIELGGERDDIWVELR